MLGRAGDCSLALCLTQVQECCDDNHLVVSEMLVRVWPVQAFLDLPEIPLSFGFGDV